MSKISFNFRGKTIQLDENGLYFLPQDYRVVIDEETQTVTFGLTPPGNIKEGGYRSLEFTVSEGEEVSQGDVVAVAVTGKIKYLESPASGKIISLNEELEMDAQKLHDELSNPSKEYLWLVSIKTSNLQEVKQSLVTAVEYMQVLRSSENDLSQHNGPGSPTCQSVYKGIKEDKGK